METIRKNLNETITHVLNNILNNFSELQINGKLLKQTIMRGGELEK